MDTVFSEELRTLLMKAETAEEIKEILSSEGIDASEEKAERIFEELKKHSSDRELSEDELQAVTGGAYGEGIAFNRDWAAEGCAATVETGSWCWSSDNCLVVVNNYTNPPTNTRCPACGGIMYIYDKTGAGAHVKYHLRCISCGAETIQRR